MAKKTMSVELVDDKLPKFKFSGEWVGKDIDLVRHRIIREYRLSKRTERRTDTKPIKEESNERPE